MYDPLSLEVWSITFPVGLQIQHAEDLTVFSLFLTAALTTACDPVVVTLLTLAVLTFSLRLLVLAASFWLKALLTGAAVLTGLTVLIDAADLRELCLAVLTSTYPDFVTTAVGTKFLLDNSTAVETILNMSPENKEHYQAEKESIHLLLTGIGDDIYSTVDACKTAHEMWIAIERLQQGESLNIQDVKTNLFWEFGKFTSRDGESMESYYSRFYKMMNEMIRNNLTVATMQYQKEVNEICAETIAKNANPLALVAAAQQYPDPYYQAPKSHKSYAPPSKQASSTRSIASTKLKGKEIAKPITPLSESASEEDSDPEQA
ncbi:hypothetical protein Tco_0774044 [Tanacetum coccineum]|uniref:Gag-Pol polyprotein n=1 Tax=Tanacetum coccineum TaxID=301880 RepID=A0ABQ4ZME4_9ASTR